MGNEMPKTVYRYYDNATATLFEAKRAYAKSELSNDESAVTYIGATKYNDMGLRVNAETGEAIPPKIRRQVATGGSGNEYVSIVDGTMCNDSYDLSHPDNADLRPVKSVIRM